jgi:sulfatase maturation enzyme AslB (radical SAM superfamily)
MSNREKRIRNAISNEGRYLSSETGQLWIVRRCGRHCENNRNYVIEHQHPRRKLHIHGYAETLESATKKISKHEKWTMDYKG